jgi:hypothetical protein
MNRNIPPRGNPPGRNRTRRIENATVEDVFVGNRGEGYILVSHGVPGINNMVFRDLLRLNVSRSTRIRDQSGRRMNLRSIQKGMRINAVYSAAVTRSIPPQAEAYEITVFAATRPTGVTTDRVVSVDPRNNILITGNPRNPDDQTRFIVNEQTVIRDQFGRRIRLADLQPGDLVRIEHAEFYIMIYPQQIVAYRIQVLPRI